MDSLQLTAVFFLEISTLGFGFCSHRNAVPYYLHTTITNATFWLSLFLSFSACNARLYCLFVFFIFFVPFHFSRHHLMLAIIEPKLKSERKRKKPNKSTKEHRSRMREQAHLKLFSSHVNSDLKYEIYVETRERENEKKKSDSLYEIAKSNKSKNKWNYVVSGWMFHVQLSFVVCVLYILFLWCHRKIGRWAVFTQTKQLTQ